MKIENINAVITGGGSGLGEGTARVLSKKGANVLLIDLNAEGVKKVATDIDCNYIVGDVTVYILSERIQYYSSEGKLITESLKDYTRKKIHYCHLNW